MISLVLVAWCVIVLVAGWHVLRANDRATKALVKRMGDAILAEAERAEAERRRNGAGDV